MKVLWIEDQVNEFKDLDTVFVEVGIHVTWVSSPEEFITSLDRVKFDAILIDIRGKVFNGLAIYRDLRSAIGETPTAFMSAWLASEDITRELSCLSDDVFLLDKNFPSIRPDFIEATFKNSLIQLISRSGLETNRTYYQTEIDPKTISGEIEYTDYVNLSFSKKKSIRETALENAKEEIDRRVSLGDKWLLIQEPSGVVLRSEKSQPENFTSRNVAFNSHDTGISCFVYEPETIVEEVAGLDCPAHYKYYYTIDIQFDSWEKIDRIHFDTGSEYSWFDKKFLIERNIGFGLLADHQRRLRTADGKVEDINFFRDNVSIRVLSQENNEMSQTTRLQVNGLEKWREITIGGRASSTRLCIECQEQGYCALRVGLVGQNLLRPPDPIGLVLDGATGSTSPRRASTKED